MVNFVLCYFIVKAQKEKKKHKRVQFAGLLVPCIASTSSSPPHPRAFAHAGPATWDTHPSCLLSVHPSDLSVNVTSTERTCLTIMGHPGGALVLVIIMTFI